MGKESVSKKFVYIAVIFGVLLTILIPPFQSPDEDSHFKKAFVMAEGRFYPEVQKGQQGYWLSENMVEYIADKVAACGDYGRKFSYQEVMEYERNDANYSDTKFYQFSTMETSPIGHIIPATGIVIGKVIAKIAGFASPSVVYYLFFARLANLAFFIIAIALSIRITPILKRTFSGIALMPMTLYLAVSPSYDVLLISSSFLFAAVVLRLRYDKVENGKVRIGHIIFFGAVFYLYIALKIVYLPLGLIMLFFIPKEVYKDKKVILKHVILLSVVVIGTYLIGKIPYLIQKNILTSGDPAVGRQIRFVLENPVQYVRIFCQTLWSQRNFYISTSIGVFGLLDTWMYSAVIYIYAGWLFVVGISEISIDNIKVTVWQRLSVIIASAVSVFGIFLAMYIYWTSIMSGYGPGAEEIVGVQGRYFIPLFPMFFLVFANQRIVKYKKGRNICKVIAENSILVSLAVLPVMCLMLLLRFWA